MFELFNEKNTTRHILRPSGSACSANGCLVLGNAIIKAAERIDVLCKQFAETLMMHGSEF